MAITTHLSITTLNVNGLNVPIKRSMTKEGVIHIYNEILYYLVIKINEILPFVTAWMGLGGIMLSKTGKRKKNAMILLICGI